MSVPGPALIQPRLDRAEKVGSAGAGQELSKSCEVRIRLGISSRSRRIDIVPFAIGMPEFHQGTTDGVSLRVQDTTFNIGDCATGRGEAVVQVNKIIILVQGNVVIG